MKVTKEKAAAHRAAIVKSAADLFRAHGVDGVAVAEIMQATGLTHGGFYGHFASKDALAAEACGTVFAEGMARVAHDADGPSYIARYMRQQRDGLPGGNCPMETLGSEIGRQDPEMQARYGEGVAGYLDAVTQLFARSGAPDAATARAQAIATVAALVGGMMLARGVAETQPALSAEIIETLPGALSSKIREGD